MKQLRTNIGRSLASNILMKLTAAALGVLLVAPVSQARDKKDVDFGIRADSDGNVGLDLSIFSRDCRPAPVVERVDRVWVDPVYRCQSDRVWVDAVWVPTTERVFCPPVTKDAVEKIWVEPTFETREVSTWENGRRVTRRDRAEVAPGHYEERHSSVVVREGRWDTVQKWALRSEGHWETRENWVLVSDGHWEDHVSREVPVARRDDRGDRYRR